MKKKVMAVILAMCLCVGVFAGCKDETPPIVPGEEVGEYLNPTRTGTINVNLAQADFSYRDNALLAVAQSYMAKYPGVTVNVEAKTSSTYKNWLEGMFSSGSGDYEPDIVQTSEISKTYVKNNFVDYTNYLNTLNPYAESANGGDKIKWKNALSTEAYTPFADRSGIYSLSIDSLTSFFFYNKDIWAAAGLTNEDGTDKIPATWSELEQFSAQIKATTGKTPLSLGGKNYTYDSLSWLMNMYTDQYFRDIATDIHAQEGDYCYDPEIDAIWKYDNTDPNNDSFTNYTMNPLRFYKGVKDGTLGTDNDKYRAMITNFLKVIPAQCQSTFTTEDHYQAQERFWQQNAAITFNTSDFFNRYKYYFEITAGAKPFEMGFFPAPPMTGEGASAPAASALRSVGGATGWYGIIKKDKAQNDLAADFMMYWASPEGQTVFSQSMKEQDAFMGGNSMVKNYVIPEEIYPASMYEFPGLCHNNPMGTAFGELTSSTLTVPAQQFTLRCQQLFSGAMGAEQVRQFSVNMQNVIKNAIPVYLENMQWRSDALDNVKLNPNI